MLETSLTLRSVRGNEVSPLLWRFLALTLPQYAVELVRNTSGFNCTYNSLHLLFHSDYMKGKGRYLSLDQRRQ